MQDIHTNISEAFFRPSIFTHLEVIFMKKNLFIMMSQYGQLLNRIGDCRM